MPQSVGDVLLVTFDGFWHNQRTMTTFHYGVSAVTGGPSNDQFALALKNQMALAGGLIPTFLACCPPAYLLNNVWVQTLAPVRVVKTILSVALSGQFDGDSNTANLSTVVTRRGSLANRANIGSVHVPYPNLDADGSDGTIGAPMLAALGTFATQVRSQIAMVGTGTVIPVLFHGPAITDVNIVTSTIVQLTVRTMRRRTVGRGI